MDKKLIDVPIFLLRHPFYTYSTEKVLEFNTHFTKEEMKVKFLQGTPTPKTFKTLLSTINCALSQNLEEKEIWENGFTFSCSEIRQQANLKKRKEINQIIYDDLSILHHTFIEGAIVYESLTECVKINRSFNIIHSLDNQLSINKDSHKQKHIITLKFCDLINKALIDPAKRVLINPSILNLEGLVINLALFQRGQFLGQEEQREFSLDHLIRESLILHSKMANYPHLIKRKIIKMLETLKKEKIIGGFKVGRKITLYKSNRSAPVQNRSAPVQNRSAPVQNRSAPVQESLGKGNGSRAGEAPINSSNSSLTLINSSLSSIGNCDYERACPKSKTIEERREERGEVKREGREERESPPENESISIDNLTLLNKLDSASIKKEELAYMTASIKKNGWTGFEIDELSTGLAQLARYGCITTPTRLFLWRLARGVRWNREDQEELDKAQRGVAAQEREARIAQVKEAVREMARQGDLTWQDIPVDQVHPNGLLTTRGVVPWSRVELAHVTMKGK